MTRNTMEKSLCNNLPHSPSLILLPCPFVVPAWWSAIENVSDPPLPQPGLISRIDLGTNV